MDASIGYQSWTSRAFAVGDVMPRRGGFACERERLERMDQLTRNRLAPSLATALAVAAVALFVLLLVVGTSAEVAATVAIVLLVAATGLALIGCGHAPPARARAS